MTTTNLKLSLVVQNQIVHDIFSFYKSLLIAKSDLNRLKDGLLVQQQQYPKPEPILRTRIIPFLSELEPNEARKIVIEGYLSCSSSSSKAYISLVHVSNCIDYVSHGLKIKCSSGSNNQPNQHIHSIHGSVCDHNALQWVMENNLVSYTQDDNHHHNEREEMGGFIPHNLAQFISNDELIQKSLLMIPFVRELVKGRGGKVLVKSIKVAQSQKCNLKHG